MSWTVLFRPFSSDAPGDCAWLWYEDSLGLEVVWIERGRHRLRYRRKSFDSKGVGMSHELAMLRLDRAIAEPL